MLIICGIGYIIFRIKTLPLLSPAVLSVFQSNWFLICIALCMEHGWMGKAS